MALRLVETEVQRAGREIQRLTLPAMQAIAPVLVQAQRETAQGLQRWLATVENGELRYTTQRYRATLVHLTRAFESIEQLNPALARALGVASTAAGKLAVEHLTREVARFSSVFAGSEQHLQLNLARILATGERALIPRFRTSAARYAGNVGADIRRELAVGVVRGETVSALTDRLARRGGPRGTVALRGIVGQHGAITEEISEGLFARYRGWGERVVRTEVQNAYNTQKDAGYAEALVEIPDLKRRWDASLDLRVCPDCGAMHGTVAPVGGPFPDGTDGPPKHPNCRCVTVPWRAEWASMGIGAPARPVVTPPPVTPPRIVPPPAPVATPAPPRATRAPRPVARPRATPAAAPSIPVPVSPGVGAPTGTPVSTALDVRVGSKQLAQRLRATLAQIDQLHGDGALTRIPVLTLPAKSRALGEFREYKFGNGPAGIAVRANGSHPEMTLAHEVGHFLDGYGVGGAKGQFATETTDPRVRDWRTAVMNSRAVRGLLTLRTAGGSVDIGHVDYLLRPTEIFARSYAQWVATRSGNARMLSQLTGMRARGFGVYYPRQWDEADFAPIAAEFDHLFRVLGWIT